MGPDAGVPPEIRFANVGQTSEDASSSFDLIITNTSAYEPHDSAQNRLAGGIAQISLSSPTAGSCESSVRLRLEVGLWLGRWCRDLTGLEGILG